MCVGAAKAQDLLEQYPTSVVAVPQGFLEGTPETCKVSVVVWLASR